MAAAQYRIVSGADSEIHDEPHLPDSRLTDRDIHARAVRNMSLSSSYYC